MSYNSTMKGIPMIPYFQTTRYRVDSMVSLAQPRTGEIGVDLGSGDGRIVIAFAKLGVAMHGFETDPVLIEQSLRHIHEQDLKNAYIHQKDFWEEDLSLYDIITIYPMPDVMELLEKKLEIETKIGARILINYYPLPSLKHEAEQDHIYLYRKTHH
jgi:ribosomal protein L11 methylase PrmA